MPEHTIKVMALTIDDGQYRTVEEVAEFTGLDGYQARLHAQNYMRGFMDASNSSKVCIMVPPGTTISNMWHVLRGTYHGGELEAAEAS